MATFTPDTFYDPATFKPASHHWMAYDYKNFCGCGECRYPIGYGATEEEAIADYNAQVEDEQA